MARKTAKKAPPKAAAVQTRSTLEIEQVPIGDVKLDPDNARMHADESVVEIRKSLERFGQQKPIVVDQDGVVVAGNGTLQAASQMGWTEIAVVRTTLSGAERRAFALADNRTAELSKWDPAVLSAALAALSEEGHEGLEGTGFTAEDMAMFAIAAGGTPMQEGDVPLPPDVAVTQRGDVWVIGRHRLMNGDSSSPDDLDTLLDGAKIHLVNMDPPYNVKVEPRSNNAIAAGLSSFEETASHQLARAQARGQESKPTHGHHQQLDVARHPGKAKGNTKKMRAKDRPLANDFISDKAFEEILLAWFGNASRVLIDGGSFYIWGGYANVANYPPAMIAAGFYFSQAIIWVKEHPVLTRKDFMGNHEWCFYGWKEGAAHRFFGPANVPDVWNIKKVNPQSMVHLTEKPAELAARAIQYSSIDGENVLDLFGGSGSTMVGAEQTGRNAYLMELDDQYCDVILMRMEKLTGVAPVLLSTGKTYAEMRKERGVIVTADE